MLLLELCRLFFPSTALGLKLPLEMLVALLKGVYATFEFC